MTGGPGRGRIRTSALAAAALAVAAAAAGQPAFRPPAQGSPREPVAPFRVIANIFYVGSSNAGSFLIATPDGHILIDSGYAGTETWVRDSIERLGFSIRDVKVLLNTHAHHDHVGGHAQLKEWTGARVLVAEADAAVLADGGRSDFRADGRQQWRAVAADGLVRDGDEVRLGGVTLVAHLTPGHTKGNTTWTTTVADTGRTLQVVFVGSMGLNRNVPLVRNAKYPSIADDYARSFAALKALPCDVFLAFHADHFDMAAKRRRLYDGLGPNPFIDPEGFTGYVTKNERAFLEQLRHEREGRR